MLNTLLGIALPIAHVAILLSVLSAERRAPSATLAWLLAVGLLPGVGAVLYLLIGTTRARRLARRTAQDSARIAAVLERQDLAASLGEEARGELDPRTASLIQLGERLTGTPTRGGNDACILVDAEATYRSMIEAVEAAQHHVHVEFFIVRPDATGLALREHLVRRAREGVEVRVLVDAVGSKGLPSGFWAPLREVGGQAARFNPVSRFLRWRRRSDRVDFRNHRKIVVVDGEVGFTGGINVGREYLGLDPQMGHWRDTHVRLEGPAVLSLQATFARDWLGATGRTLEEAAYFPEPPPQPVGPCVVQVVDSGPDRKWSPIAHIYAQALHCARERIWITTPYFVPSPAIENALVLAALRGVDVRLLLPGRADHLLVTLASHSYFPALLEAGARIFRYGQGFLHSKTLVVDSWLGSIGSANLDMRSFHLNFELNAFVHGARFADEMAELFREDLEKAWEVAADERAALPERLVCSAARLLSPLL